MTHAAIPRRHFPLALPTRVWPAVAVVAGAFAVTFGVVALIVRLSHDAVWPHGLDPYWRTAIVWSVALGGPGAALAWLRPRNPIGWLVCVAGLLLSIEQLLHTWAVYAVELSDGTWWFHPALIWVGSWIWVPGYALIPTLVLLLVPDGRLPSPGWRWVAGFQMAAIVIGTVGFALTPWDRLEPPITWQGLQNPVAVAGAEHVVDVALAMVAAGSAASVVSLVVRARRASSLQRQQLKWVLLGAVLAVGVAIIGHLAPADVAPWAAAAAVLPLVVGTVVAVLRHRLWHVEAVIARSAVAAALTVVVVAAYLSIVWLAGAQFGAGGAQLIALVIVTFGLQPVRLGLQRQINRLLYGQRDDPYAVLAALGQRLDGAAGAAPGGEALPGVARTIAEALRLPYVGIVVEGDRVSSHGQRPVEVATVPLTHAGDDVGVLEIGLRRGEQRIDQGDHALLSDVARRLAGAARNLQLTRALQTSRHAIVTAREEERRRLHRDVHDDLGPALAALVLQLETAHDLVGPDPDRARDLLRRLGGHAREAVDVTRRIVTDLRPATLDDLGLVGSLEEVAARFSSPQLSVTTALEDPGPLPAAIEVVLLRVTAEALTNTVRHSAASTAQIVLRDLRGSIELTIDDDGIGIDDETSRGVGIRSMRDRIEAIGGRCRVERRSVGTRVHAVVPVTP